MGFTFCSQTEGWTRSAVLGSVEGGSLGVTAIGTVKTPVRGL